MTDEAKQRVIDGFLATLDAARAVAAPSSYAAIEDCAEAIRRRPRRPAGGPVIPLRSSTVHDLFTKPRRQLPRWEMSLSLVIVFREMTARRGLDPDATVGTVAEWKQRHEAATKELAGMRRAARRRNDPETSDSPHAPKPAPFSFPNGHDGLFDVEDARRAVLLDWAKRQRPASTGAAGSLQSCLVLEEWCSRLRIYDPHGIPAHLQTAEFAAHLQLTSRPGAEDGADPRGLQAHGQRMLRRGTAVLLWFVLEERTLRRPPFRDMPADVWRRQLRHMLELTELNQVTIQIRPAGSPHFCAHGPIRLLRFRELDSPDVLVLHQWHHALYPHESTLVCKCYGLVNGLAVSAAPPDESVRILHKLLT
ncbi:hypothetical protein AGRA3207_002221 [Actinomadura graeca]|uniref:DUF5753 domain-containing protein n=1 Tax=Actinomadura graeca TaxID=2750812 RepID=A0ABX8QRG2_9ACTN|nr:DUF5753 domain-containing protein [Actinomadura graeca]QXJ21373.1 hypothetical protein AGRA3207_002221 [Actinomadura graeca]